MAGVRSRLNPSAILVTKILSAVAFLFFYCEFLIYYVVLRECSYPSLNPNKAEPHIHPLHQEVLRVMVLADTHLLGSRHGHWFDKLRREWQMYRAFQTALYYHNPDVVFILGDLTDEGLYCSDTEFECYVRRFHSLFDVPESTKLYVVVGNHDIGFHYGISPYLNQRFVGAFNAPGVQLISLKGNHFVLINSMALEGDGCFLCKPVEQQLYKIQKILECSNGTSSRKCDQKNKLYFYSRPILIQHFPLYRESDMECSDFDSAPFPLKQQRFRERWDCLGQEATVQLLKQLDPRLVLTGHTHHGCTRRLMNGKGVEITVPSFSWRNKENPNFGLVSITPNNNAYSKCEMPRESTVIMLYVFGTSLIMLYAICTLLIQARRYKYKYKY